MSGPERERPKGAATPKGQPKTVEANGSTSFAHSGTACKQDCIAIPRSDFERLVQSAIDLLDRADGDADSEANGDECDGSFAEDEAAACFALSGYGPGCIITDCDSEHDGREPEAGI